MLGDSEAGAGIIQRLVHSRMLDVSSGAVTVIPTHGLLM